MRLVEILFLNIEVHPIMIESVRSTHLCTQYLFALCSKQLVLHNEKSLKALIAIDLFGNT